MPGYKRVSRIYFDTPKSRATVHLKVYFTDVERRSLLAACGDAAYLLLEYYIRIASLKEPETLTDEKAAAYFGWKPEKAKRLRHSLIREGWFAQERISLRNGSSGLIYFIGQEAVLEHKGQ
jgi:hypothetical protein